MSKPIEPENAVVLVVEDNLNNFLLITRLLAYLGVKRCEWKASGFQVVEFVESFPQVDLVLMDINLPERDGYEALNLIRSEPRLKNTLVVAVTADASQDNLERARKAGFDGFIGKPLNPDLFPQQIRGILRGDSVWEL
ncbi:MAG: response regulator [Anaerolineae bacterium]|nr:response regulator [Anaerolineae bacterium]